MNSIGNKIRIALIGSISVVAVVAGIILFINQFNVLQNQKIIQTMTMEYSIYSLSEELVKMYNEVGKNPGNTDFLSKYNNTHTKIQNTISILNNTITRLESKALMAGVEHTANQVIFECDTGLSEIQNNNFADFSEHFASAHKYNAFVLENTRTLVQKELDYLSKTQETTQRNYTISISISVLLFILILLFMISYSHRFTRQLITPLVQLSLYAKDIASGNLETDAKQKLVIHNDEIGSLTQSIYTMVDKLMLMLSQEKQASETTKTKNDQLARMNALMVDRELKMVELKKQIEELKQK
jgi:nitrogen fixation/metabolism regulation signal transduction histidine kinase